MMHDMVKIGMVIYELEGTCNTLEEACADNGLDRELTSKETEHIDENIFCCSCCGWWCEQPANELNDEWVCDDCFNDE